MERTLDHVPHGKDIGPRPPWKGHWTMSSMEKALDHVLHGKDIGPRPPWKGQHFVLTGADTYSGYAFTFLTYNASAKITNPGPIECLVYCHGIPHSITSDKGTHFTEREV
ncbi:hypothetical protein STEG23_005717 [Scotinomys teguina]